MRPVLLTLFRWAWSLNIARLLSSSCNFFPQRRFFFLSGQQTILRLLCISIPARQPLQYYTMANKTDDEDRVRIVQKYDIGREEGAVIEDWEDPDLSVYNSTDRYGFMHTKPIATALPDKVIQIERERAYKWSKMLKKWHKYWGTDKLLKRVNKGIPDSVRGEVWKHVLDIEGVKEAGIYESMKDLGRRESPDIKQIDVDVLRTFRNHVMYRDRYGIKQQALFHVLVAYSMYNPVLGYTQGMSSIAAMLLMYLNEEDAFWAMVILIGSPRFAMHGMLIPGLPKLLAYCDLHGNIRRRFLPKLDRHFMTHHIDPSEYTTPWFVKCYLDAVPFQLTLRIWDAFLFNGESILVSASLVLLRIHRKTLLRMREDEIRIFLQELDRRPADEDTVITELDAVHSELVKANLAMPPATVRLQDLSTLNHEAKERAATSLRPHPQTRPPTSNSSPQRPNGYTTYNGHVPEYRHR